MDTSVAGRVLMGDSLGFHIIIAMLSIGIPLLMNIFEFHAWRKKDPRTASFVRLLTRWAAVLVIAGIISGTVISLQFTVLWAPFLATARPFIGQFFALETYAFLIEAVFLSWYIFSAKTMSPGKHFLIGIPITIGAIGSAIFITIINAWMNNPADVWTTTTLLEITHSVFAYILATTILIIGFVSWRILRTKTSDAFPQWLIMRLGFIAAILIVVVALLGHQSAVNIASTQPTKLAAIEILDKTQSNAPLRIGGEINKNGVAEGGIVLPGMLSILAGYSPDYTVRGLDEVAADKRPSTIVHALFDIKMLLVGFITALIIGILIFYKELKRQPKWFLYITTIGGISGMVLVELGWMLTEIGRQPWAITGKLMTVDAFTRDINVIHIGYIFPILFVILFTATGYALSKTTKHWRIKESIKW